MVSEAHYRIKAVATRTGLSTATLRAWERRYGVPQPFRTSSGYRLYSQQDVDQLERMVGLQEQGMPPSESARLVRQEASTPVREPLPTMEDSTTQGKMVDAIYQAALDMDQPQIEVLLHRSLGMGTAWTVYCQILQPVLERIGDSWERGEVSIGQEHFATTEIGAVVRNLVRLVRTPLSERTLLLACIEDENHEIPLYGVAILAESLGWKTCILGARTPPDALTDAIEKAKPSLIGLSVTAALEHRDHQALFEAYARVCGDTHWLVGGRGAAQYEQDIEAAGGRCFTGSTTDLCALLSLSTNEMMSAFPTVN